MRTCRQAAPKGTRFFTVCRIAGLARRGAFAAALLAACGFLPCAAQAFTLGATQVDVAVAPFFDHTPVRVAVASEEPGFDVGALLVSSSAAWVTPATESASGSLVLSFATAGLINQTYTATITATLGGETQQLVVNARVAPLNVVKLRDDPRRSRTYGIQQEGVELGSLVAIDPISGNRIGNVTVGRRPSDVAFTADGTEALVINCVDETISVVDLASLSVKETIALPAFDNWDPAVTFAHIGLGPGSIVYYTDGAWGPRLRVFDRATGQVLQTHSIDSGGTYGFGGFATTGDLAALFGWAQYGWSAGWAGSYASKFTIDADGLLTFVAKTASAWPTTLVRDPLGTPVLVSADGATVFVKQFAFSTDLAVEQGFPTPVYSIAPRGEVAVTATAVYETATGIKLADLPRSAPVQTITSDCARLVYFDSAAREIRQLNLLELVGPAIVAGQVVPADGAVTLAPPRLEWPLIPGGNGYRVYLGTSEAEVGAAGPASPLLLGEVWTGFIDLTDALSPGVTYFWRVDLVGEFDVVAGEVFEFTVSPISSNAGAIRIATVRGHRDCRTSLELASETPGATWAARADVPWISFTVSSGVTPAALEAHLDASNLPVGLHRAQVVVSDGATDLFALPVEFRVEPLTLTILRSDAASPFVYGISEATESPSSRAYLVEINALSEEIARVTPVGTSATDLAIHRGDNRVYVPNWSIGSLLAVDLGSFAVVRSYAFAPFGGVGYGDGDVYRVSAGGPGRLVVEEMDQWIDVSIFDTASGAVLARTFEREGGGGFDPTRRFYYHGDNNSSGAEIHKFDVTGDMFTEVAHLRVSSASYYGSRTVVVSEDGSRVFWNGVAFDADLAVQREFGEMIYAASSDGRYAFGETRIFDVETSTLLPVTTPATAVKAFNTLTGKLVYNAGPAIGYLGIGAHGDVVPPEGAIVSAVPALGWEGLAVADAYQVYLGTSDEEVAAAGQGSPAYLGETPDPTWALPDPLAAGDYCWRFDIVTAFGTVVGELHHFTVSPVVPDRRRIEVATLQGQPVTVQVHLSSPTPGETWEAATGASWIQLEPAVGTTPGTLAVTLAATAAAPATLADVITIGGPGGELFTIPVTLQIDPLKVTVMKSDPSSSKVYAVSEDTSRTPSRAYLLEIDTASEAITRVAPVGTSVTDLAIHHGDDRAYVPNWSIGSLLAVDLGSFAVVRSYPFAPFGGVGYGDGDVYRVSAGAPGRLVVEEMDQWVDVSIFDTASGTVLGSTGEREGGGGFDPTGRFYYHGDNNSSGAEIHKFDVTGDVFAELAHVRVSSASYYGSRTIVVSADGSRVFWNGSAFDPDLVEEWRVGAHVYAASANGRFAFGSASIYDVDRRRVRRAMPVVATVCAYNDATGTLVVQQGATLLFWRLNGAPTLDAVGSRTVDERQTLAFVLHATDPDGDPVAYTGDGLPPGATLDAATGIFSWTPGPGAAGAYEVSFRATDDGEPPLSSGAVAITITVTTANSAPVLDAVGDGALLEGETLSFTLHATDPDGDAVAYAAAGLPSGASLDAAGGEFFWTPGYDQAGVYFLTFWAVDDVSPSLESAPVTVTITVSNPTGPLFTDDFADGASDLDWVPAAGSWRAARGVYTASALRGANLSCLAAFDPAGMPIGALSATATIKLTSRAARTGPNGMIVFAYRDQAHYRWVKVTPSAIFLGQKGAMDGVGAGTKRKVARRHEVGRAARYTVNVLPDGWVRVFKDGGRRPVLSYRFTASGVPSVVPGGVCLGSFKAKTIFDNVSISEDGALGP